MAYILLIVASLGICSADPVPGEIGKELEKNIVAVAHPIEEIAVSVVFSHCAEVKKLFGASYEQIESSNKLDFSKLTLEYRGPGITTIFNLSTAADRIPQATGYDPAQNLYIYIPGFSDEPSGNSFSAINKALLSDGQSNVLALDASSMIKSFYLRSSTIVRFIGRKLAEVLAAMAHSGYNPSRIHIIGHSLGAHLSGFTGKSFTNLTGVNVGRITGLDPAGPCFADVGPELRLRSTDADFVDVIHTDAGVAAIKDAVGQSNVLALDASSMIKSFYLRSSTIVRFIGRKLAEVLAAMAHSGYNPSRIHIIGHSLGAHLSGFTGKSFTNLTGVNVGRITGLDPAGPCFADVGPELMLRSTDADFVDVIHTDAGVAAIKDAVGQVDYYPNNGYEQPNCGFNLACNHGRAWHYFAESVTIPDGFLARKCKDYGAFKKGQCEDHISPMGFASKPGTTGVYYLQTAGDSPYGLGVKGLTWQNNQGLIKNIADKILDKP